MWQIVITLEIYGVKNIVGIPFGYRGFSDKNLPEIPVLVITKNIACSFFFLKLLASQED